MYRSEISCWIVVVAEGAMPTEVISGLLYLEAAFFEYMYGQVGEREVCVQRAKVALFFSVASFFVVRRFVIRHARRLCLLALSDKLK